MGHDQDEMTRLGFWGLIPFVAGAAAMWASPFILPQWVALNIHSLVLAYAGIIAAFLAGTGVGAALTGGPAGRTSFLPPMIAALIAWFAIWPGGFLTFSVPAVWRYVIIIAVFAWLLMRDLAAAAAGGLPAWYGALRIRLTFWACVSLILIMARLITWRYF